MEGKKKAPDTLNIVNVITIGVVGTLLTWVSIIALQAYYKNTLDDTERAREVEGQGLALESVNAEERAQISSYGMRIAGADPVTKKPLQVATIDIERAKELVVSELQENEFAYVVPAIKHNPCACEVPGHNNPTLQAVPPYNAVEDNCPAEAKPDFCPGKKKAEPKPADGTEQPTDGATPADGAPKPADGAPKPADGAPKPADGAPKPGGAAKPGGDANP